MSQELDSVSKEAIQAFEQGIEKENNGALSEAVICYRKAIKLDENVEKLYRDKIFKELPQEKRKDPNHNYHRVDEKKVKNINVDDLLKSFANLTVEAPNTGSTSTVQEEHEIQQAEVETHKPVVSPLMQLPEEIWLEVMEILAITDTPSWFQLSISCKRLSYLGFHNSAIWRRLCLLNYPKMHYNIDETELNGISKDQDQMVQLYDNNWKLMLQERPFVKFHGIYISVVHYFSEGGRSEGSSAWTNPIRMITYYRYFRFFHNGEVIKLLTVDDPTRIVPYFHLDWKSHGNIKNVFKGRWEMTFDGMVRIEGEGSVPKYYFIEELQIKNNAQRRHHKLHWNSYYCMDKEDGERNDFTLKNEKPFAFSRVKSYSDQI